MRQSLYINGFEIDIPYNDVIITYNIADLQDAGKRNDSYVKTISVTGSKGLDRIFNHFDQFNRAYVLSDTNVGPGYDPTQELKAAVIEDGVIVFNGSAKLFKASVSEKGTTYEVTLNGKVISFWEALVVEEAAAADGKGGSIKRDMTLQDLEMFDDYNHVFDLLSISQANAGQKPPVPYDSDFVAAERGDGFIYGHVDRGYMSAQSYLGYYHYSYKNYHFQMYLRTVIKAIEDQVNKGRQDKFKIKSSFFDSNFFRDLVLENGNKEMLKKGMMSLNFESGKTTYYYSKAEDNYRHMSGTYSYAGQTYTGTGTDTKMCYPIKLNISTIPGDNIFEFHQAATSDPDQDFTYFQLATANAQPAEIQLNLKARLNAPNGFPSNNEHYIPYLQKWAGAWVTVGPVSNNNPNLWLDTTNTQEYSETRTGNQVAVESAMGKNKFTIMPGTMYRLAFFVRPNARWIILGSGVDTAFEVQELQLNFISTDASKNSNAVPALYGDMIDVRSNMKKQTVKDFMLGMIRMFNLYLEQDAVTGEIRIEPFDLFFYNCYNNPASALNWADKVVRFNGWSVSPNTEIPKYYEFKHKEKSDDFVVKNYFDKTKSVLGDGKAINATGTSDAKTIDIPFTPFSMMRQDSMYAYWTDVDGTKIPTVATNPYFYVYDGTAYIKYCPAYFPSLKKENTSSNNGYEPVELKTPAVMFHHRQAPVPGSTSGDMGYVYSLADPDADLRLHFIDTGSTIFGMQAATVSFWNDLKNPNVLLQFSNLQQYLFDVRGNAFSTSTEEYKTNVQNLGNLYTNYYSTAFGELSHPDYKLFECKMRLKKEDINRFTFRLPIYLQTKDKGYAYFKVHEIKYNGDKQLSDVKLLRILPDMGVLLSQANGTQVITYKSQAMSGFFTCSTCPTGQYGSSVEWIQGEGYVTSTISQIDADEQARILFERNGQDYADSTGTCTARQQILFNTSVVSSTTFSDRKEYVWKLTAAAAPLTEVVAVVQYQTTYLGTQTVNMVMPAGATNSVNFKLIMPNHTSGTPDTMLGISILSLTPHNFSYQDYYFYSGSTFFQNVFTCVDFQKDDCGAGYRGSTESYCVPAGTYYSNISQADANAKAQADIDANGQAYANSTGSCAVLYYNTAQSGTYTKQGCPTDTTAQTGTYVVPANTYSSTVSVADANDMALADIAANGQTYVNNTKICMINYWNVAKSGVFQKATGCGTGYVGQDYTYTVPAHTYMSTVSQADADQMAIDDVAANGQTAANTYGACRPADVMFWGMSATVSSSTNYLDYRAKITPPLIAPEENLTFTWSAYGAGRNGYLGGSQQGGVITLAAGSTTSSSVNMSPLQRDNGPDPDISSYNVNDICIIIDSVTPSVASNGRHFLAPTYTTIRFSITEILTQTATIKPYRTRIKVTTDGNIKPFRLPCIKFAGTNSAGTIIKPDRVSTANSEGVNGTGGSAWAADGTGHYSVYLYLDHTQETVTPWTISAMGGDFGATTTEWVYIEGSTTPGTSRVGLSPSCFKSGNTLVYTNGGSTVTTHLPGYIQKYTL